MDDINVDLNLNGEERFQQGMRLSTEEVKKLMAALRELRDQPIGRNSSPDYKRQAKEEIEYAKQHLAVLREVLKAKKELSAEENKGGGKGKVDEMNTALKESRDLLRAQVGQITGMVSAWSPYIAKISQARMEMGKLQPGQLSAPIASKWNPYIAAIKKAQAEQAKLNQMSAMGGPRMGQDLTPALRARTINPALAQRLRDRQWANDAALEYNPAFDPNREARVRDIAWGRALGLRPGRNGGRTPGTMDVGFNANNEQRLSIRESQGLPTELNPNELAVMQAATLAATRRANEDALVSRGLASRVPTDYGTDAGNARIAAQQRQQAIDDEAANAARAANLGSTLGPAAAMAAANARKTALNGALVNAGVASHWEDTMGPANMTARAMQNAAMGSRLATALPAGGGIDNFNTQLGIGNAAIASRYGNVSAMGSQLRTASMPAFVMGAAGAYGIGKSVKASGEMEAITAGFVRLYGKEAGEQQVRDTVQFAKDTPFSVEGSTKVERLLAATGFEKDKLLSTMTALGNAVAATGQGEDVLRRIAVNLGQIRNMEKVPQRDLNQFAYAGINIKDVMKAATGQDMSTEDIKKMNGKDFVEQFTKGANLLYGGAMDVQMATIQGQISRMSDSFYQLGALIGNYVTPVAKGLVGVLTWISEGFQALPSPISGTLVWLGVLAVAILLIGGAIGMISGSVIAGWANMMMLANSMRVLSAAMFTTNAAGITLSTTLFGSTLPAMTALGVLLFSLIAIVWGIRTAILGTADASSKSAAEMAYQWGGLGRFWVWAGDGLSSIMNHPVWNFIKNMLMGIIDPFNLLGQQGSTSSERDDETDHKSYEIDKKKAEKKGQNIGTYDEWYARTGRGRENEDDNTSDAAVEEVRKSREGNANQSQQDRMRGLMPGFIPGATSPTEGLPEYVPPLDPSGAAGTATAPVVIPNMPTMPTAATTTSTVPTAVSAMGQVSGGSISPYISSIRQLEDSIASVDPKDKRVKSWRNQIRQLRRQQQDATRADREAKQKARADERARKDEVMANFGAGAVKPEEMAALRDQMDMTDDPTMRAALAQKMRHSQPGMRSEREEEKQRKIEQKRRNAIAMAPYQAVLANPNSTKSEKANARVAMFNLRKSNEFAALGLSGAPQISAVPTTRNRGLLDGASIFDSIGGTSPSMTRTSSGGDSSIAGLGIPSQTRNMRASLTGYSINEDMSVHVIFEGDLPNPMASMLGRAIG
jgi:hypothetical protein